MIRRTLRGAEALALAVGSRPAWVVPAGASLSRRLRIAAEPAARLLAAPWNPAAALAAFDQNRVPRRPSALGVGAVVAAHAVTVALANDPALRGGVPALEGISHGANLAFAAEGLRLFANSGARNPLLDALVAAAGSIGHLLLAQGLR
ncbi:hypothetical protein [Corynebacterium senegalense]|uniref:hypothetical protein n=1 Tax=Corynebacterium senegalense TaxID=2080750 RepID=UPI000E205271|nr:hypothetical protein [Corynebacterium senegalense]